MSNEYSLENDSYHKGSRFGFYRLNHEETIQVKKVQPFFEVFGDIRIKVRIIDRRKKIRELISSTIKKLYYTTTYLRRGK